MNNVLLWKKLNKKAIIPRYQHESDAGFDFHAIIEKDHLLFKSGEDNYFDHAPPGRSQYIVPPKTQCFVDTGLSVAVPFGWQMEVRPRSGLALKKSITIVNSPGTLDSGYRGPVKIILYNLGNEDFIIEEGDRIAQGVIMPAPQFKMKEVKELPESDRGEAGFGSTD